jgi:hypothetical protein
MAVKDVDITENEDREKDKKIENENLLQTATGRFPAKEISIDEKEIKNAHASGDGSFGRNDESVPDKEANDKKNEIPY